MDVRSWVDDIDFTPNGDISNPSAATTSKAAPASDRDDNMLFGINVQRDVRVERAPKSSSSSLFV